MSKLARTALVTSVGAVVGAYSWALARRIAYQTLDVDDPEVSWGTPDSPNDDYDLDGGGIGRHEGEYEDDDFAAHAATCENCKALGEPGVMNAAKLRSIAAWIDYSDSLLERLLDEFDDIPSFMTQEQVEYLLNGFGAGDNAMIDDLIVWADMLDEGLDPLSP
jgi:hypothetical protein